MKNINMQTNKHKNLSADKGNPSRFKKFSNRSYKKSKWKGLQSRNDNTMIKGSFANVYIQQRKNDEKGRFDEHYHHIPETMTATQGKMRERVPCKFFDQLIQLMPLTINVCEMS